MQDILSLIKRAPNRFTNLIHLAPKVYAVLRSGAFSAKAYVTKNPDVPSNRLYSTGHFVKYCSQEHRTSGQTIIADWLLKHLLWGNITSKAIRDAQALLKSENETLRFQMLKAFCADQELPYKIIRAYIARSENNKPDMLKALRHQYLPKYIEEALILHYDLVKICGFSDTLKDIVKQSIEHLNKNHKVSLKFYIALFQFTQVLKIDGSNKHEILALILTHMAKSNYRPAQTLRADLWMIGIYLPPELLERPYFKALIPKTFHQSLKDIDDVYTEAMTGWEAVFEAMALNVTGKENYCVTQDTNKIWRIVPANNKHDTATVRVLTRHYWVKHKQNTDFTTHLMAFKQLCESLSKKGYSLYPIPAGQIYDLTDFTPDFSPLLSYHTFSKNCKKPCQLDHKTNIHFKESALKGFYSLDKCGFSGWACPDFTGEAPLAEVNLFFSVLRQHFIKGRQSKYGQADFTQTDEWGKFIFVPLQVPDDVVAQLCYIDIFEALHELLSNNKYLEACGIETIVIKVHPKDTSDYTKNRILNLQNKFRTRLIVTDGAIHDLLASAKLVMTVNSGVGTEALMHLKPVIALGASDYGAIAVNVLSIDDLKSALNEAAQLIGTLKFKRSVKDYFFKFYYQNAFQPAPKTIHKAM